MAVGITTCCIVSILIFLAIIGIAKIGQAVIRTREAKACHNEAIKIYKGAQDRLEIARKITVLSLENLGWLKLNVWDRQMGNFVRTVEQIRDIELSGQAAVDEFSIANFTRDELSQIKYQSLKASEIVTGGLTSIGTGALLAYGTYTGVMALGTASTGAAIGGLSGAAATSATLAWLGGGSLAAGGLGMAGGMVVLGGIVLSPAIALGGVLLSSKAKKNLANANKELAEAKKCVAEMDNAVTVLNAIRQMSDEYHAVITQMDSKMSDILVRLQKEIEDTKIRTGKPLDAPEINYKEMTDEGKRLVHLSYLSAQMTKILLETPILNENGELTEKCKKVIDNGKRYLQD